MFSSATETANITINPLPIIASVTVPTNGNYKIGDVLNFTVNFSEAVTITGSPILPITLNTGGVVNATFNGTGASATSHNFTYTIASGNLDPDGITVGTALNLPVGATIQNIFGGNAILNLNSVGSTVSVFVDGVVPTVTLTSSAPSLVNAPFTVTATFSEAVTVFDATDIIVGNGTAGNFQTTDNINYTFDITPTADGNVTVDIAANVAADNAGNNNSAATQLTRIANIVNDAPTLTNISRTGDEDTNIVLTANDFINAFSDVDANSLSQIKITSLPDQGILKLSDAEVTVNQEILAADLNNLTFTPADNFTGITRFTWNGYDGQTYAVSDAEVNLNIVPINDAPSLTTVSKSGTQNSQIAFAIADFTSAFADLDNDSLSQIKITSLPANGILNLNGTEVTVNQEIAVDQLSNLNFTPNANFNGNTSFTWNGYDGKTYADTDAFVHVSIGNIKLIQPLFSTDVQENGGFDLYKVKLATQPTADVTINITTDGQIQLNQSTILFTPSSWNIAQTVMVKAVDDNVQEELHSSEIIHTITSSDARDDNLTVNLTANVSDNDDLGEVFEGDDRPNLAGTNLTDRLLGTVEINILHGREGNDFIDGQGGSDRLYGLENDDYILGGDGDDKIWGGQDDDYIEGNAGNDLMFGESGSDRLLGGDGSDIASATLRERLLGHKDNDYLSGDLGADTLTGGQGRDVFAIGLGMGGLTLEAADVITDFNVEEDAIDLMDSATAGGLTSESLNITQGTGNYANDLIIQHQATGEYLAILQGGQGIEPNLIQFI